MVRTQISVDEKLYRQARKEARRLHVSLAELCRRGLREVLKRDPPKAKVPKPKTPKPTVPSDKPWMRYAGIAALGDPRASETVDEVVYDRDQP